MKKEEYMITKNGKAHKGDKLIDTGSNNDEVTIAGFFIGKHGVRMVAFDKGDPIFATGGSAYRHYMKK